MEYQEVGAHWVFDEISKGREVYVLDKSTRAVESVNDMTVKRAAGLIEAAKKCKNGRYIFWYAEFTNEVAENA